MLSYHPVKFTLEILLALILLPAVGYTDPSITLASSRTSVLFEWQRRYCADTFTLDTPLRAFKESNHDIRAFATQDDNWSFTGPSLMTMRANCSPTMSQDSYRRKIPGKLWIEGVYTLDGKSVYALTSEDLTDQVRKEGCLQAGKGSNCWLNQIGFATSVDGGAHFEPTDTAIAGQSLDYDEQSMGRQGYFTTSNIVGLQGQYFFISFQQGVPGQKPGNCLFRTNNIADVENWSVWDGESFVGAKLPTAHDCDPVGKGNLLGEVRSLVYVPAEKVWLALFTGPTRPNQRGSAAIYYSASSNLKVWHPAHFLLQPSVQDAERVLFMYPALLDPKSKSRNFDTIDHNTAELFVVKLYKGAAGMHALNRDLVAYPVSISD